MPSPECLRQRYLTRMTAENSITEWLDKLNDDPKHRELMTLLAKGPDSDQSNYPEGEVVDGQVVIVQKWHLYCEDDYIYSTKDPEDAQSWVDADPAQHTARTTRD
jgi:hypothetical protein